MRIVYGSDMHINHWIPFVMNQLKWERRTKEFIRILCERTPGDVLVLAGDFSEINRQSYWVLEEAAKHYKKVFWTFGNHDLYLLSKNDRRKYRDSWGRIKNLVELTKPIPNIIPLIGSQYVYQGKIFAGDSLWYYPSKEDEAYYLEKSNDSDLIELMQTFQPLETAAYLYQRSMDWYRSLDHADILVTHVPPICIKEAKYPPNTCYYTKVAELKAPHWICGHAHQVNRVTYQNTKIYMNCFGYPDDRGKRPNEMPSEDIHFEYFEA